MRPVGGTYPAALFFSIIGFLSFSSPSTQAQTCSGTTTPTLNGNSWADNGTKSLYVDPNLPPAIQASIRQAASDFATQTGQSISILPAGSADPGSSTQDAIRFMNNAAGSPNNFAYTGSVDIYSATGVDTKKQVSATISLNVEYDIAPASNGSPAVPAYDPNQPNAAQYVYDVTLHELGHAYGLKDAPVPLDPTTGLPNYEIQPAGASIMNGSFNTNDQGPHINSDGQEVPGGIGATSVQSCDLQQINNAQTVATPPTTTPPSGSTGSGSGGGSGSGSGGGGGGDGGGGGGGGGVYLLYSTPITIDVSYDGGVTGTVTEEMIYYYSDGSISYGNPEYYNYGSNSCYTTGY